MPETVLIKNHRPAIIVLPPVVTNEPHKGQGMDWLKIGDPIRLAPAFQPSVTTFPRPVATAVDAVEWERIKKHPAVKEMLAAKWIEVAKDEDAPVAAALAELSPAAAIAQIETEKDAAQIAIWMMAETRGPVKTALNKRLAEIQKK